MLSAFFIFRLIYFSDPLVVDFFKEVLLFNKFSVIFVFLLILLFVSLFVAAYYSNKFPQKNESKDQKPIDSDNSAENIKNMFSRERLFSKVEKSKPERDYKQYPVTYKEIFRKAFWIVAAGFIVYFSLDSSLRAKNLDRLLFYVGFLFFLFIIYALIIKYRNR